MCDLSNDEISNDIESSDPGFEVTPLFDLEYLRNGTR